MSEQNLKEKTANGLFWTGISTFSMQVLNMVFGIFIARILLPEDYGMVGLLMFFTSIAAALQESGLTAALINKKDCRQDDYNAVFWFNFLVSLSCYIILFFASPSIARFYHIPELTALGRVSFIGFFLSAIGIVPYAILLKGIRSKQIAIGSLTATIISGIGGVFMALGGMAYWGLVLQSIGAYVIRVVFFWIMTGWKPSLKINLRPIIPMLRFGVNILCTRIFETITTNILTIFLGRYFSKVEVGYYNQANKWNSMAFSTLVSMSNNTAQPVFVQSDDEEERSRRVLRKMTRFMAFISFPCMFGLALISPEFITILLTEKWNQAIPLLRVLCIGGAFLPLWGIFSNFILSRGKSNITLITAICLSVVQVFTAYLLRKTDILTMTIAYTTIICLWLLVWQLLVRREIHLRLRDTIKDVLPFCLIAAAVMFATHFITLPLENIYLRVCAKILCAVVLYCVAMRLSNSHIYREFLNYAKTNLRKVL